MDLTKEQETLLNTEFPEEIEKAAAEQVAILNELYDVGFNKMAAEHADKEDEKEESEEHEEKELSEGQKKEGAARGAFLAQYYLAGLQKEGSERHGDELHYLYPFIAESLIKQGADASKVMDFINKMKGHVTGAAKKVKEYAGKGYEKVKKYHEGIGEHARKGYQGTAHTKAEKERLLKKQITEGLGKKDLHQRINEKSHFLGKENLSKTERAKHLGMAALKTAPHLAVGTAAVAGAHHALKKKEQ